MRIELVSVLGGSASGVRQLAQATRDLAGAQRQVAGGRPPQITGPVSRLRRAEAMQALARTPDEMEDAAFGVARAQANLARQRQRRDRPTGLLAQLGSVISSSRIGIGPGGLQIAPLVGRLADVLQAMPGPIGTVTKILLGLGVAASLAARHLAEIGAAAAQTGGTTAQVGFLARLGIPLGSQAGAAAALRERLSSDPMAMAAAGRLGIGARPPAWAGPQNQARDLMRALDALRQVTDAEEQLRLARMLGLEGMIDLIRTSDYMYQGMKRDAEIAARTGATPGNVQSGRDAMAGVRRVGEAFMNLLATITEPLVNLAGPALDILAGAINFVSLAFKVLLTPLNLVTNALAAFWNWLMRMIGGDTSSIDDNTNAVKQNTAAIKQGIYGGGERFRNALPAGLKGEAFNRAMETGAIRYGAWQMGTA